jgi:hypothetical protein
VGVEYLSAGSAWTEVASAVCGADGQWAASVELPATGKLRAVFAGDATRGRMQSSAIAVRVVPSLRVTVPKTSVRRRRAVTLSGTISPSMPRVTVLFERRVGRRWLPVQRKRITVTDGAFTSYVRPPVPGRYRLSVTGGGVTRRRRIAAT